MRGACLNDVRSMTRGCLSSYSSGDHSDVLTVLCLRTRDACCDDLEVDVDVLVAQNIPQTDRGFEGFSKFRRNVSCSGNEIETMATVFRWDAEESGSQMGIDLA